MSKKSSDGIEMTYHVKPSKGDFLLLTAMNLAGYNDNNNYPNFHSLRHKTREHFAKEINNPWILEFYNLWMKEGIPTHPPWMAMVDIQTAEFGAECSKDKNSREIIHVLEKFRNSIDFDRFYEEITPEYEKECNHVKDVLRECDIEKVLNTAWEHESNFDVHIIPRPLDKLYHGDGPKIGNNALSIIGPGKCGNQVTYRDIHLRHLIAHEVSHSYAKNIVHEATQILRSKDLPRIKQFIEMQKARDYDNGGTVLEETMMRALQWRYIDPLLGLNDISIESNLIMEHEYGKFEHIFKFDSAIREHKENPKGTFAHAMANLVEKLSRLK